MMIECRGLRVSDSPDRFPPTDFPDRFSPTNTKIKTIQNPSKRYHDKYKQQIQILQNCLNHLFKGGGLCEEGKAGVGGVHMQTHL